jgi:predicted amidohydrolase
MSSLTITLIQTDLVWEDRAANLQQLEQKIRPLAGKTELVVLPEMFSTGFSMRPGLLAETMDGPTVQWMKKLAAECRIILTGSVIIEDSPAGAEKPHYFNRLIWMLPNGQLGVYDKRHRFAYAGEDMHYTAGQKRLIASVKGWKINLLICYDLRFPVWARQSAAGSSPEYDALIYVANWPHRRIHAWKTLLQARAIENQAFVVGVNRVGKDGNGIEHSGHSMVVDPLGEILYTKEEAEDVFTITLQKSALEEVRSKLPFWKDADGFIISDK